VINIQRKADVQRGVALIEVLVSVLILGVGILGMAALQLSSLKFNEVASWRSQATFLAYDIADQMRANRDGALAGNYDIALGASAPTETTISQTELRDWKVGLANMLPSGDGSIQRNGNIFTIIISWDESRVGGSSAQVFSLETRL